MRAQRQSSVVRKLGSLLPLRPAKRIHFHVSKCIFSCKFVMSLPRCFVISSAYNLSFCWPRYVYALCIYGGRPINKLQNGIILLIFKIWIIRNIGFVRNLIVNNSCEFYYDDITVTSFVNDKMATLPLKASRKEQRSVIHFLWSKRRCPNTINSEMRPVYGDKCFTRPAPMCCFNDRSSDCSSRVSHTVRLACINKFGQYVEK